MCSFRALRGVFRVAAVCRWVESVEFCTATVEGEEGDKFVSTNIASAVCFANTDESAEGGCFEGLNPSWCPLLLVKLLC